VGAVVDLLVPPRCAACGRPGLLPLCAGCSRAIEPLALTGLARTELDEGVLAVGAYAYDAVARDAVVGLKVRGRSAAGPGLGRLMRRRLGVPEPHAGLVTTWVPSTARRLRQRGVEVPRLLAGDGAVAMLRRVGERPDQTALTAVRRRASPAGVFVPLGALPASVVLVDDVRTTGATALAAARALQAGGARRVLIVTFAVAGDEARAASGRR
jgi:predicted amidophosphoribosyltransferase